MKSEANQLLSRIEFQHTITVRLRSAWKRVAWLVAVRFSYALKRGLDVAASFGLLFLLLPLFLLVGLAIRLTDGGPVLFWQTRVGKWGDTFPFPKFRSMVVNAPALKQKLLDDNDHGAGVTFKMKRDPRITWVGRIIRKLSIDELPQLWCVLKGPCPWLAHAQDCPPKCQNTGRQIEDAWKSRLA